MWHLESRNAVSLDLLCRFAESQSLGLRKEVGHQEIMVPPQRVQGLIETDEIAQDELCSLVDKLVEGVLAVGTRLTPDDRAGLVIDRVAFQVNVFAVALH